MSEIRTYLSDLAKHGGRIEAAYQIHRQSASGADRTSFEAGYEAACAFFWNEPAPAPSDLLGISEPAPGAKLVKTPTSSGHPVYGKCQGNNQQRDNAESHCAFYDAPIATQTINVHFLAHDVASQGYFALTQGRCRIPSPSEIMLSWSIAKGQGAAKYLAHGRCGDYTIVSVLPGYRLYTPPCAGSSQHFPSLEAAKYAAQADNDVSPSPSPKKVWPHTDVIERVAKAIYEADDVWSSAFPWPTMGSNEQSADNYRRIARAALDAALNAPSLGQRTEGEA